MKVPFILIGILAVIVLVMSITNSPGEKYPNIVIITIDTVRYDHISPELSPNIDKFSKESVVFTNAFSQIPHTPPSHWSIFTGIYPVNHNKFIPLDNGTGLTTITDILKPKGYVTAGFVSSQILRGFKDEFDHFDGLETSRRRAEETTSRALKWLEDREKFFLWVHYYDPHTPYNPPEEYDIYNYTDVYTEAKYSELGVSKTQTIREDLEKYDGEILYMDRQIGRLLERLDNNTIIIIVSDHGECFADHRFSEFGYEEDEHCVFHGKTLFDEETHVPMMIKAPGIEPKKVDIIVETVDLMPTVLDILSIEQPEMDGEVVWEKKKDFTISNTNPRDSFAVSIRNDELKFVTAWLSDTNLEESIAEQEGKEVTFTKNNLTKKIMLFDVKRNETASSASAAKLRKMLEEIITNIPTVTIDKTSEEILRSLGYI